MEFCLVKLNWTSVLRFQLSCGIQSTHCSGSILLWKIKWIQVTTHNTVQDLLQLKKVLVLNGSTGLAQRHNRPIVISFLFNSLLDFMWIPYSNYFVRKLLRHRYMNYRRHFIYMVCKHLTNYFTNCLHPVKDWFRLRLKNSMVIITVAHSAEIHILEEDKSWTLSNFRIREKYRD